MPNSRSARKNGFPVFARSYRTALEAGVKREAGQGAAERIGRRAARLGLGTLALARIHDRAVASRRRTPASEEREEAFFARAVSPLEESHSGMPEMQVEAGRMAALLVRRTDELAAAEARLKVLQTSLDKEDRHHAELLAQSRLMEEKLRCLSHRLLTAQEEERLRISRDLHDAIGQTLTGINVGLATLKSEAAADSRDLAGAITRAQQLVERSMKTVHQFAWELRPTLLDDLGLVAALRSYAKSFAERSGVRVQFTSDADTYPLDADRRTALFRVAQGALSNVERHARSGSARVGLRSLSGSIRLEVQDKGRSFSVSRMERSRTNRHLGLLVMRERVEMVGGTFLIESSPRRGTLVRADVPIKSVSRA